MIPRHPEHTFRRGCGRTEGQGSPQQLLGHSPTPPGSRGEHMLYASPAVPGNTLNRGIKNHPSQPETTEPRLWLVFQHSREQVGCCRNGNSLWEPGPGSACRATPPRRCQVESHAGPGITAQSQVQQELGLVSHHCLMASEATSESWQRKVQHHVIIS